MKKLFLLIVVHCLLNAMLYGNESTLAKPPNVIFFSVDDMDYATLNISGCPVNNLTPNIDKLAKEGIFFQRAHLNSAICQPSRQSLMTGLHSHKNETLGFVPVPRHIPNLSELLMQSGWYTASYNKGRDYEAFKWSRFVGGYGTQGFGRSADLFLKDASADMDKAISLKQPFLLNISTSDPHRVYAGSEDEKNELEKMKIKWPQAASKNNVFFPDFKEICTPSQAWVPPYLPNLPKVQEEWAQYYNTVHRADETLGKLLELLDQKGLRENTIVFFYSDNGASFPTSKQNCYPYSTQTPLIIRWPGVIKPGSVDSKNFVSTMDIMPTLLEMVGVELPTNLDGHSILPLLKGGDYEGREYIFTTHNYITPGLQVYPMRGLHKAKYSYIFNPWSDGLRVFDGECHSGLSMKAIESAALSDEKIRLRMLFIQKRVKEELYDTAKDPWCLNNLAEDKKYAKTLLKLKELMLKEMDATSDPLLPVLRDGAAIPPSWFVKDETSKKKKKS